MVETTFKVDDYLVAINPLGGYVTDWGVVVALLDIKIGVTDMLLNSVLPSGGLTSTRVYRDNYRPATEKEKGNMVPKIKVAKLRLNLSQEFGGS